jgi:hypothetical protein
VRFPEFKRASDLADFSEVWPSFGEDTAHKIRGACCRISILLTLVALMLPITGIKLFTESFPGIYSTKLYFEILGLQLLAPAFLFLLELMIGYCVMFHKRVPPWVVIIGLAGAGGMLSNSGEVSHNFSHALFGNCTGYSDLISWLAASVALLLLMIWLLEFRVVRERGWMKIKMTRRVIRVLALLSIFGIWLGILYFFEILPN